MSVQTIYNQLCLSGMSQIGACAMLGNMQAESGLQSNIAQRGMTSLNDEEYTRAADRGAIDFARDSVGYGLCQWTYHTRKAGLLSFAKQRGKSVGDEQTQVRYCIKELQEDYSDLWQYLRKTDDIDTATDRICAEFERPAINNFVNRREHARRYAAELIRSFDSVISENKSTSESAPSEFKMDGNNKLIFERIIQIGLEGLGYSADKNFDQAVHDYSDDIKSGRWS